MLHYLKQDQFTLVIPSPQDVEPLKKSMEYGRRLNHAYLKALVMPPTGGRITGTFIYAHPPDYVGRPTMEYGIEDWRSLLRELKELGVDTVIYQAAVWLEVQESYYPSKLFASFKTWNSIEPLCSAVAAEGLTLYLGGLGNLMCFDENATPESYNRDRDAQLDCFKELMTYKGGFHGFYMSPETAYPGRRQPEREALLNRYFRDVCQGVKDIMPSLPILLSPGTYYAEGQDQNIYDFLYSIFKQCPIDLIAPQDSIGTFGNRLSHLKPAFDIWSRLSEALGFKLWVNAESFERVQIGTANDFVPADFERLRVQLAHASQVSEKIVSWEVPYFYSPLAGERGLKLRRDYLAYLAAS